MRPLGEGERPWRSGLRVAGDGTVSRRGETLPNRFTWLAFQPGVDNARYVDPADPQAGKLLDTYFAKYPERTNPVHPVLFERLATK